MSRRKKGIKTNHDRQEDLDEVREGGGGEVVKPWGGGMRGKEVKPCYRRSSPNKKMGTDTWDNVIPERATMITPSL